MKNDMMTQKRKGLDALRGIGIIGIVLYHLFPSAIPGGFLGVPLFFVLSGYLMFVTSEHNWEKGDFHIGSYYKKRIKKILPPLFSMVMVVCCYLTLTESSLLIGLRHEVFSIFLGYDNWWQIRHCASYFSKLALASPFTHLWFLAVEIQFYILWPFLFLLYQKCCRVFGGRKMCFIFFLLALLSAGRMFMLYTPGEDPSRVYYGTDTMAFPLFIGIFLGAARQQYRILCTARKTNTYALFTIFLLTVCALFVTVDGQYPFLYRGGMFFISLFFALLINMIENREDISDTLPRPSCVSGLCSLTLSLLGKKSYGIYLWHYPLIVLALI